MYRFVCHHDDQGTDQFRYPRGLYVICSHKVIITPLKNWQQQKKNFKSKHDPISLQSWAVPQHTPIHSIPFTNDVLMSMGKYIYIYIEHVLNMFYVYIVLTCSKHSSPLLLTRGPNKHDPFVTTYSFLLHIITFLTNTDLCIW